MSFPLEGKVGQFKDSYIAEPTAPEPSAATLNHCRVQDIALESELRERPDE